MNFINQKNLMQIKYYIYVISILFVITIFEHPLTLPPFLFTQIIWAAIFGNILFSETLDLISLFGIVIIICSGTLAM